MKFLSPKVALYLYKSTICPCIEYCCHAWASVLSCYLELLCKLQKQICRTDWLNWFHFLFLEGGLLIILINSMIFLSPFLDVTRMTMSTVSFLTQLDSLPIECFSLTYDLSGSKSRINRYLLTVGSL